MAIIVETGAIVANANSYSTLADADAYFEAKAITAWSDSSDDQKEAALIAGHQAMDLKYQDLYFGYKVNRDQTMQWPRTITKYDPTVDDHTQYAIQDRDGYEWLTTEIPSVVKRAGLECALIYLGGTMFVEAATADSYIKRKKLDVLETEWFEGVTSVGSAAQYFELVDRLLQNVSSAASPGGYAIALGLTQAEIDQIDSL